MKKRPHTKHQPGNKISTTIVALLLILTPGTPAAGEIPVTTVTGTTASGATTPVQYLVDGETEGFLEWRGIYVEGSIIVAYSAIKNAERGIAGNSGADISIINSVIDHNRVGIHAYGCSLEVTETIISNNQWYGIKEDAIGAGIPVIITCRFLTNGYDYYHEINRDISIDELNAIVANHGNTGE